MNNRAVLLSVLVVLVFVLAGCRPNRAQAGSDGASGHAQVDAAQVSRRNETISPVERRFVLQTRILDGRMVYVGVGGEIDGVVNPDLAVQAGETVQVTVSNQDGLPHDLAVPDLQVKTSLVTSKGTDANVQFAAVANQSGIYDYFCTTAGHRQAGMQGKFIVR